MKTVSVIIPVYFNADSLPPLYDQLTVVESELHKRDVNLELIIVDDGSKDNSWEEIKKIKRKRNETRIVKLSRNFGAVHASKTGFQFITGDCFMILAADLQDPPELIIRVVDKWLKGSRFIICTRKKRQDPVISRIFSTIYYMLLKFFVVKDYPQGGFDLALMDKVFLPYLLNSAKNINTPLFAYWLGFNPEKIEYDRQKRMHGRSRWSMKKRFKFFLDSILGFSFIPLRLISGVGILVSFFSFVYGLIVVTNALIGNKTVSGFATLVALLTFLLGLVIIMLGIIGEYIWRIYDEVNKRPESVIDEIL